MNKLSKLLFELSVASRWTFPYDRKRHISFISSIFLFGMVICVTSIITILSLLNGIESLIGNKILNIFPHMLVFTKDPDNALNKKELNFISNHPNVSGVSSYIDSHSVLVNKGTMYRALLVGVKPEEETKTNPFFLKENPTVILKEGEFGIVLGYKVADHLGLKTGQKVGVLLPPSPDNIFTSSLPRMKNLTVVSIYYSNDADYDDNLAMIHYQDMRKLVGSDYLLGFKIRLKDPFDVINTSKDFKSMIDDKVIISEWTVLHENFFRNIRLQRTVFSLVFLLVVAITAFNLISSLIMMVVDKKVDIAILKSLGLSDSSLIRILAIQGSCIGLLGSLIGVMIGVTLSYNLNEIIHFIDNVLGLHIFPNFYLEERIPSEPKLKEVVLIFLSSLGISILATIYPSYQATKTNIIEVLKSE